MNTTPKKTISVLGSYGEGNVGDEAILDGILKEIRKLNADTQIIVFSHNPKETMELHEDVLAYPPLPAGVKSFFLQTLSGQLQRSMYALKSSKDIIIGGGGIFYDHGFSTGKNPVQVWHTRVNTIKRLGKEYRLYAVGVSALRNSASTKWMKDIAEGASQVDVRDAASKNNLESIGVTRDIGIVDDPALQLEAPKHEMNSKKIGISVRRWYLNDPKKQEQLKKTLAELLEALASKQYQIVLIPFSIGNDDDRTFMEEIISLTNTQAAISDQPHTVSSRMKEIASCDILIGMRLHSIIFAHLTGTPFIALGYAEKVNELTRKLDAQERYVDLENLSAEKILKLI